MSVWTLKQTSGGTSSGFTNIKSSRNMSRSDWKCSPENEHFQRKYHKGCVMLFPRWANGWAWVEWSRSRNHPSQIFRVGDGCTTVFVCNFLCKTPTGGSVCFIAFAETTTYERQFIGRYLMMRFRGLELISKWYFRWHYRHSFNFNSDKVQGVIRLARKLTPLAFASGQYTHQTM